MRKNYQSIQEWPKRTLKLMNEPVCHSDDEEADDGTFYRLLMPARSIKATKFFRTMDHLGLDSDLSIRQTNAYKKISRSDHPDNKHSEAGLPSSDIALDWHDPEYFNQLPAHIRARYFNSPIALPLDERVDETGWAKLEDREFMEKYGNEVRELYEFPTEDEMEAIRNGGLGNEEEDPRASDPEEDMMDSGV